MIKFSQSQIDKLSKFGDDYEKEDGSIIRAIYEQTLIENQGQISQTTKLTCQQGQLAQNDIVTISSKRYEVGYIDDDNSGIIDAHLNFKGDGVKRGKYI